MRLSRSALVVALALLGGELVQAQNSPSATADPQSAIALSDVTGSVQEEITSVEIKLVKAAEKFPEDLFNTYRPEGNKDLSTVAELLLEVADFNATSAFQMSTKPQQHAMKKPDDRDYDFRSKAETVTKVKQSFAAARKAIQDNPDPKNLQDWLFVVSFSNEAYGRVRTYFSVKGLNLP